MRQYKFRGRAIKTSKYVYGDFLTPWADDQKYPMIREYQDYHEDEFGNTSASLICWDVEPSSLAQLVGRDCNGMEVYEKDTVVNPTDGTTFKAAMNHIYTIGHYQLKAQPPTAGNLL